MADAFDLAPKVELHLHLEGAIPRPALWSLIERYGDETVRAPEDLDALLQYRDFAHFIETWQWLLPLVRSTDDFTFIARAVAESLAQQRIVYAEASISPTDFRQHGIPVGEVAIAVRRGLDQVEGTHVALLVDLVRDTGPEWCLRTLESIIDVADEAGVVGITIGGMEAPNPPERYVDVYRRAESAGLGRSVHAGEAAGPDYVWSALRTLGVDRIGHGVRSVEDAVLVDHLVEQAVPLEVCPTSNLRTGVVASWESHPVVELIERGARVTINSDDPLFFDCSVAGDLRRVSELTELDVERHTGYAIDATFMPDERKAHYRALVGKWWATRRGSTADA